MHKHKETQKGRVELNIGGYEYMTSVETLRRIPGTLFDAYFSGRYPQDVCKDGSIFLDRDGEHFGHILDYMRDGVMSVIELEASEQDLSILRWLNRELGFYCIVVEKKDETVFAVGGTGERGSKDIDRLDVASGTWRKAAPMNTARVSFGLCCVAGEQYAIGGCDRMRRSLGSVERYIPSADMWGPSPSI